jgi:hypothetical protein
VLAIQVPVKTQTGDIIKVVHLRPCGHCEFNEIGVILQVTVPATKDGICVSVTEDKK